MSARLDRLRAELTEPLLLTDLVNIFWLTGFESSNAALLVAPDDEPLLFTDFRYIQSAERVPAVRVEVTKRALLVDLADRLDGRVQFEADAVPYAQYEVLARGGLELVPTRGIVASLRSVKDETEIDKIRRAARAADRAFEALTAETWVGRTERELAWRLRTLMHAHGVDHLGFDTVIAAGANGSLPHAEPGDDTVQPRQLVVADFGARLDGYRSDCTRTVSTGGLPRELRAIYDVCLEAQQRAVAGIRPGITGVDADGLARQVIDDAGYGEHFGHGLGHGVGLDVHEAPRLSPESTDTLEVGNVFSIEPGIYLPGVGGVRIEDLVVLRDNGAEVLTSFPKQLTDVT